eukprot:3163788-Pleurochrysis_carterae.AAC.1
MRGVPVVVDMHTCLRCEVLPGMDMLPGISFTPAWQRGRDRERADPLVRANVHRFQGERAGVYWRADLGHLCFLWRVVREVGLGANAAFTRASSFVSFAFAWSIRITLGR